MAATAKHFVGNDSETDRLTVDVRASERTLREVYLAPFEAAVEAGVWLVMAGYNAVAGTTMTASPLLAEPLKGEWGFDGVAVSDWAAVRTTEETGRAALDLAMPGPESPWGPSLVRAVRDGLVAEEAVDEKVRRLLRLADRVGALEPHRPRRVPATASRDTRALLRRAVSAGSVLLRNSAVLPLDAAELSTVAVVGEHAASPASRAAAARASSAPTWSARWRHPGPAAGPGPCGVRTGTGAGGPAGSARHRPVQRPAVGCSRRAPAGAGRVGAGAVRAAPALGRLLEPDLPPGAHTVEIGALLSPRQAGEWTFGVGGFGRMTLTVDGRTLVDGEFPGDTDDPAVVHVNPPVHTARAVLSAKRPVHVVARRELVPGRGRATVVTAAPPEPDPATALGDAVRAARGPTPRSWSSAPPSTPRPKGTTAPDCRSAGTRTSWSAPWPPRIRARSWSSTAAARSSCPGVRKRAPSCSPGSRARKPARGWPTCCSASPNPAAGCPPPGPRPWRTRPSPAPGRSTAGSTTPRACTSATGRGCGRDASPPTGSATGSATRRGSTWPWMPPAHVVAGEPFTVRVTVRNTGARAGREVVQVYLARPGSAVERPVRWFAGHAAVRAEAGRTASAEVVVGPRALRHWSEADHGWSTEPGPYRLLVGRSAGDPRWEGRSRSAASEGRGGPGARSPGRRVLPWRHPRTPGLRPVSGDLAVRAAVAAPEP
ncbi:hypothetical protein GCM10020295_02810 [Streptomyces cinereospinus]